MKGTGRKLENMFRLICVAFWLFLVMLKLFGIIVMPFWFVMLPVIGYAGLFLLAIVLGAVLALLDVNLKD